MRWVAIFALSALSGCTSVAATYVPAASSTLYGSIAEKKDNPAKGTKTCTVDQLESRYVEQATGQTLASSTIFANVDRDGTVGLAVGEDTYPGSKAFFLIDGHRYSGDGDHYVTVPVAALIAEKVVNYTYTDWPYNSDHSGADVLAGFKAAYDDCMTFLK